MGGILPDKSRASVAMQDSQAQSTSANREAIGSGISGFIAAAVSVGSQDSVDAETQVSQQAKIQQLNGRLLTENETLRLTMHCIGDGVIITDSCARVSFLNPAAEQLLGWSNREAASVPLPEILTILSEATHESADNPVIRCLHSGEVTRLAEDTLLLRRDGSEVAIDDTAAPILDHEGQVIGAVMIFRDVTDRRDLVRKLRHQALHDSLTGLDNRRSLELSLTAHLEKFQPRLPAALLYLDLDQFKVVNDTGGHAAGDMLLREVATILQAHVRAGDKIARLGGDEFGILLANCSREHARRIGNEIRERIAAFRFDWETKCFSISVSVGVIPISATTGNLSSLLIAADDACYAAKHRGGNRVHVFEEDDCTVVQRHDEMQWVERINFALRNERFRLFVQAILPLRSSPLRPSEAIEWAEVLVRMQDEDGRIILPAHFIPAAEKYGLITAIDRWVVRHSLEALQSWRLSNGELVLSINVSGPSLSDEGFLAYVMEEFARAGIHGSRLRFEITETAAITSVAHAMRFVSLLKSLGCQFGLDDFGTGMSSFSYLKSLSIDYLKIPGRFVENMTRDRMDYAMVEGIHRTSRAVGIQTVAEHVDDAATLEALQSIGVDYVQGNLLSVPAALKVGAVG